ncbi:MAG: thioredoxin [Eubacteriales bacterium]|nr:thioredoxin [Eubacteriales bacterium]MDD4139890.1 thioredoxin [Eubacteriales bacterium]MDD4744288.1 thioredoxin [Eubacteriales bacterium]
MALTIKSDNFDELVMKSDKPVMIDFWAVWCGPCRMVAPTIDKLAEDYKGRAVVGKVNVDEESDLAEQFRVMSIPTLYVLKNGQVVERLVGARPYNELAAILDKHL